LAREDLWSEIFAKNGGLSAEDPHFPAWRIEFNDFSIVLDHPKKSQLCYFPLKADTQNRWKNCTPKLLKI